MRLLARLAIAGLISACPLLAAAEPPPPAVIVLDGSGSMGGPLEGQQDVKFDMAREAIRAAVTKADPAKPIGLVVAGHRRKGNCGDVELVTPPAPATAAAMMARLDRIGTVGKGPLVQALREAAKTFQPGQPGSMVLIHDGPDNCRQDPCAAAADITRANPNLTIHVVTVSLDPLVAQAMSCVAKGTGGRQFVARDAASFNNAVGNLIGAGEPAAVAPQAAKAPEAVEAPKGEADGPPRIKLDASLAAGGAPLPRPIAWRISPKSEPDKILIADSAPQLTRELPAGTYVVEAGLGIVTRHTEITVADKGETAERIALGAGALKVVTRANKSGETISAPFVTVSRAPEDKDGKGLGDTIWLGRTSTSDLVLPAGKYVVRVADSLAMKEAPVALDAGQDATAEFVMGTGRLELSALASENGQAIEGVTFLVETDEPDAPQGRRELARTAFSNPTFVLTAGTYYATARLGTTEVRDRVAIGTGDVVKRALVLGVGSLTLSAVQDAALASKAGAVEFRVLTATGPERVVATTREGAPDLMLPLGRYRVQASIPATRLKSEVVVDIVAGQPAKVALKLETADVTLDGTSTSSSEGARLEVRDGRGQVLLRSIPGETRTVQLSPGPYVLRTSKASGPADEPFELKAGERRTFAGQAP